MGVRIKYPINSSEFYDKVYIASDKLIPDV